MLCYLTISSQRKHGAVNILKILIVYSFKSSKKPVIFICKLPSQKIQQKPRSQNYNTSFERKVVIFVQNQ